MMRDTVGCITLQSSGRAGRAAHRGVRRTSKNGEGPRAEMKWKDIPLPALPTLLSTGEAQPFPRETWPAWARTTLCFSGAWFSYV
jgi:hypothetical protein